MKILRLFLCVLCASTVNLRAATPIVDAKLSGANGQVVSGATVTIKNGATVAVESGATVPWQPSSAVLASLAGLAPSAGLLTNSGTGVWTWTPASTFQPSSAVLGSLASPAPSAGQIGIGTSGGIYVPRTISGDATVTSAGAITIAANAVTLAKMATIPNDTILGNVSGGAAVPSALTFPLLVGAASAASSDFDFWKVAAWGDGLTLALAPFMPGAMPTKAVCNFGVGGNTSTQIKTRMIAATGTHGYITNIWAGRNNVTDPTTIKADIATMVAALGTNSRFLILSVTDNAGEPSGSTNYNTIVALNSYLAGLYPSNYFDLRSYLIAHGLADAGITPTTQDTTDIGNDSIPTSLRGDSTHLNAAGYAVAAAQIAAFYAAHFADPTSAKIINQLGFPVAMLVPPPVSRLTIQSGGCIYQDGIQTLYYNAALGNLFVASGNTYNTTGNGNVAVGLEALLYNTTGYNNVAVGMGLRNNDSGYNNVAVGIGALDANVSGAWNMAVGTQALYLNTTGSYNVAIGSGALQRNTTGVNNMGLGASALAYNTTGSDNVAIGFYAGVGITTGSVNTAIGYTALYNATTTNGNVAIGSGAGTYIADGVTANATPAYATYLGTNTRALANGAANEVVIGYGAIGAGTNTVTLGSAAVAATYLQGAVSATGSFGVPSGGAYYYNSIPVITAQTALNNYFFGRAGNLTMTGGGNLAIGPYSLSSLTSGTSNFGAGTYTLYALTTGSQNTALGYNTGIGITTGNNNTIIGASVTGLSAGLTDNIILATGQGTKRAQFDGANWTFSGSLSTNLGLQTVGAADSGGAGYRLVRVPN